MLGLFKNQFARPLLLAALSAPLMHANLTAINLFSNAFYFQTSSAAPAGAPAGYFFDFGAYEQNAGDFTSVSVTYPGPGSPQALTFDPTSNSFGYGSPVYDLASYVAQYPFGSYVFNAYNGGVITQTETLNFSQNLFASATPALSPSSYTALTNAAPGAALNLSFNSFTPAAGASGGSPFFSIYDQTANKSVFGIGLPYGTTSFTVPAGTLTAGHSYSWELDFSDRLNGQTNDGVFTTQGFDLRTDGSFTTPTPEPGFWIPLSLGMTALIVGAARRRRAVS